MNKELDSTLNLRINEEAKQTFIAQSEKAGVPYTYKLRDMIDASNEKRITITPRKGRAK